MKTLPFGMKVTQLKNWNDRAFANQIVIDFKEVHNIVLLQSYDDIVVSVDFAMREISFYKHWNLSSTTLRAVVKFLQDNIGFDIIDEPEIIAAISDSYIIDIYGERWEVYEEKENK